MAGVAGLVALVALAIGYRLFLESGLKRRTGVSAKSDDELRELFVAKVARLGWALVDDDNPMVAQSGLMTGRRQQISLQMQAVEGGVAFEIYPSRFWRKGLIGTPYKAHTLRIRMNSFVAAAGSVASDAQYGAGDSETRDPAATSQGDPSPTNGVAALASRFAAEQTLVAYDDLVDSLLRLDGSAMTRELSDAVSRFEVALRARSSREQVFATAKQIAAAASA